MRLDKDINGGYYSESIQKRRKKMKHYTVVPNKDVTTWFLKIENEVPIEEYDKKDEAIDAGEEMARQNQLSKLAILNKDHELEEERNFND